MNDSKPYGPSRDPQTSVPTRFTLRASPFPSPQPSLGERENPPLAFSTTQTGVCPTNFPNNRTRRRLFPLPVGEG